MPETTHSSLPSAAQTGFNQAHKQTVFVVDDDEAIRDALGILVSTVGLAVRKFASATAFLEDYDNEPGVLLLDVRMPGMSGLELQAILFEKSVSGLSVMFMSGYADISVAVEAFKRGAVGFLQKPFRDQELLGHIHKAIENNRVELAAAFQIEDIKSRKASLTHREQQVMAMISDGKTNKNIALDLGISRRTLELHCASVMTKMGVRTVAQLVRVLERAGITGPI